MMKQMRWKRFVSALLSLLMLTVGTVVPSSAKTVESAKGEQLFFYAVDGNDKSVLMDILTAEELKSLAHGQADGSNYYYSSTDNYPTTQYCEGKGFTISELLDYEKKNSKVKGADSLSFSGSDVMGFMATDSFGNYTRSWTAEQLVGEKRYYFEGMYGTTNGWKSEWEIGSEDESKFGMDMESYNSKYAAKDAYYQDKRSVFEGGVEMPVILATESNSGRTTSETLVASTEQGIASYISANGGTVAGCLKNALSDAQSLRLCIPMTETDLMAAHRTAYDNFKWVYNMRLDSASSKVASAGTVAAPQAKFALNGNTLTITMSCATQGAQIYYSYDGSPQTLYTGPVTYDVTDRKLESNPVTVYMSAVKEGCDDAGVVTAKYPQSGVTFQTLYSEQLGNDITFTADTNVTAADWSSWTNGIIGISMKEPQSGEYAAIDKSAYKLDASAKTLTFKKDLFKNTGAYSFIVYAKGFSNKNLSVSLKKAAPALTGGSFAKGSDITLNFEDDAYQNGLYVYAAKRNSEEGILIPTSYLDRTQPGKVIIKKEYFASESCVLAEPGEYTLELTNSNYTPTAQKVDITVTGEANDSGDTVSSENITFNDVKASDWYAEYVSYVVEKGLLKGTGDGVFSPNANMNRGMLVTVLYRMAGSPAVTEPSGFSDVAAGQYYADAVAWAKKNDIVSGLSETSFGPSANITREQLAAILMRYAKACGEDTTAAAQTDLSRFKDSSQIHEYALDAFRWAVGNELIGGMPDGTVSPASGATRAQVAKILMSYMERAK